MTSLFPLIFQSKHINLYALGRLKSELYIFIWPLKQHFKLKNQRNWRKQIWMLKFCSVINCILVHWTKKLTLVVKLSANIGSFICALDNFSLLEPNVSEVHVIQGLSVISYYLKGLKSWLTPENLLTLSQSLSRPFLLGQILQQKLTNGKHTYVIAHSGILLPKLFWPFTI